MSLSLQSNRDNQLYDQQLFNSMTSPMRRPLYLPGPMAKGNMFEGLQMFGDAFTDLKNTFSNRKLKKELYKESLPEYYRYTVEKDPNDPNEYVLDNRDLYDAMIGEGKLRTPDVYQSDMKKYSMVNFDPESGMYNTMYSSRPINEDLYSGYSDIFGEGSKSLAQFLEDMQGNPELMDLIIQAEGAPEGWFPYMEPDGRMGVTEDPDYLQYYYNTMMGNYKMGGSLPEAQFLGALKDGWNSFTSGVSDVYDDVSEAVSDAYYNAQDAFIESDVNKFLSNQLERATGYDDVRNLFSGGFNIVDAVKEKIDDLNLDKVKEKVVEVIEETGDKGKEVVEKVIEKIDPEVRKQIDDLGGVSTYLYGAPMSETLANVYDAIKEDDFSALEEQFLFDSGLVEDAVSLGQKGLEKLDDLTEYVQEQFPETAAVLSPFNYTRADASQSPGDAAIDVGLGKVSNVLNSIVPFYDPFDFGNVDAATMLPRYTGNFDVAFKEAREDLGPGEFFLWKDSDGKVNRYSTSEKIFTEGQDVSLDKLLKEVPTVESGEVLTFLYESIGKEKGITQDQFNQLIRAYDELGHPELRFSPDDQQGLYLGFGPSFADSQGRDAPSFSPYSPGGGVIGLDASREDFYLENPIEAFNHIIVEMGHAASYREEGKTGIVTDFASNFLGSIGNEDMMTREEFEELGLSSELFTEVQKKFYETDKIGSADSEEFRAHQYYEPYYALIAYNPFKISDDVLENPKKYGFQDAEEVKQLAKDYTQRYINRDFESSDSRYQGSLSGTLERLGLGEKEYLEEIFPNLATSRAGSGNFYAPSDVGPGTKAAGFYQADEFKLGGDLAKAQFRTPLEESFANDPPEKIVTTQSIEKRIDDEDYVLAQNAYLPEIVIEAERGETTEQDKDPTLGEMLRFDELLNQPESNEFRINPEYDPNTAIIDNTNVVMPQFDMEGNYMGEGSVNTNISQYLGDSGGDKRSDLEKMEPLLEILDYAALIGAFTPAYPLAYGYSMARALQKGDAYAGGADAAALIAKRHPAVQAGLKVFGKLGPKIPSLINKFVTKTPARDPIEETINNVFDELMSIPEYSKMGTDYIMEQAQKIGQGLYDSYNTSQQYMGPQSTSPYQVREYGGLIKAQAGISFEQWAAQNAVRISGMNEAEARRAYDQDTMDPQEFGEKYMDIDFTVDEVPMPRIEDDPETMPFDLALGDVEIDEVPMPRLEDDVVIASPTVTGKKDNLSRFLDSPFAQGYGAIGRSAVGVAQGLDQMFGLDRVARQAEDESMGMTAADNAFMVTNPLMPQGRVDVNTGLSMTSGGFGLKAKFGTETEMEVEADPETIKALIDAGVNVNYI